MNNKQNGNGQFSGNEHFVDEAMSGFRDFDGTMEGILDGFESVFQDEPVFQEDSTFQDEAVFQEDRFEDRSRFEDGSTFEDEPILQAEPFRDESVLQDQPVFQDDADIFVGLKREEQITLAQLFDSHDKIERNVNYIPNGVIAETKSRDPEVVKWIQDHVFQMFDVVERGDAVLTHDPLFNAMQSHHDVQDMQASAEIMRDGIRVTHTSSNACGAKVIQAHADVVTDMVESGPMEALLVHEAPC